MEFIPHDYQEFTINKILELPKCGLFLDMGLGKTSCALTAINELMFNSFDIGKVLVIAPKRVAEGTWSDEIEKWDHLNDLRISVISGTARQRIREIRTIYQKKRSKSRYLYPWQR